MPNRPRSVCVDQPAERIAIAAGDSVDESRVGLPTPELGSSWLVEHGQLLAST